MNAVAIILAAGEAPRLGQPKALLEHEGDKSFLQSLASTFAKAGCEVLGVVGKDAERVRAQHPTLQLVEAERWADGPVTSLKVGLALALEEGAQALLVHPVDMPAVRASTLKQLLRGLVDGPGLRPEFEGAPGWPLVLSRSGAEALVATQAASLEAVSAPLGLKRVVVKDPGVVVNINTPEIYERLLGFAPRLAPPPKRRGKAVQHVAGP